MCQEKEEDKEDDSLVVRDVWIHEYKKLVTTIKREIKY